jgi:hypothetical protein
MADLLPTRDERGWLPTDLDRLQGTGVNDVGSDENHLT